MKFCFGAHEQSQSVTVEHNLNIHVFRTDGVDVTLDTPHGASIFLVLGAACIVDVIDHLLLAITVSGTGGGCQHLQGGQHGT